MYHGKRDTNPLKCYMDLGIYTWLLLNCFSSTQCEMRTHIHRSAWTIFTYHQNGYASNCFPGNELTYRMVVILPTDPTPVKFTKNITVFQYIVYSEWFRNESVSYIYFFN